MTAFGQPKGGAATALETEVLFAVREDCRDENGSGMTRWIAVQTALPKWGEAHPPFRQEVTIASVGTPPPQNQQRWKEKM